MCLMTSVTGKNVIWSATPIFNLAKKTYRYMLFHKEVSTSKTVLYMFYSAYTWFYFAILFLIHKSFHNNVFIYISFNVYEIIISL